MTRARQCIPFFFALALGAAPLCAQTEQPAPAQPAAAPTDDTPRKTPAPPASAGNATQRSDTGSKSTPRADSGKTSPFDYRASEEISEDLPVSFPADI